MVSNLVDHTIGVLVVGFHRLDVIAFLGRRPIGAHGPGALTQHDRRQVDFIGRRIKVGSLMGFTLHEPEAHGLFFFIGLLLLTLFFFIVVLILILIVVLVFFAFFIIIV